jgi:hypothetical protein
MVQNYIPKYELSHLGAKVWFFRWRLYDHRWTIRTCVCMCDGQTECWAKIGWSNGTYVQNSFNFMTGPLCRYTKLSIMCKVVHMYLHSRYNRFRYVCMYLHSTVDLCMHNCMRAHTCHTKASNLIDIYKSCVHSTYGTKITMMVLCMHAGPDGFDWFASTRFVLMPRKHSIQTREAVMMDLAMFIRIDPALFIPL